MHVNLIINIRLLIALLIIKYFAYLMLSDIIFQNFDFASISTCVRLKIINKISYFFPIFSMV